MTKLWIGFAVVIVYGSIYPFNFQFQNLDATVMQAFLDTCCDGAGRGDILANVILFVPFGYLGIVASRGKISLYRRVWVVCILGSILALALQIAQIYLPSRDESLQDVGWNFIGTLSGVLLGSISYRYVLRSAAHPHKLAFIPCLLIGSWLIYRLIPFVPSIDFESIKASLKPLLLNPQIQSVNTIHDTVAWLVVASLLQRVRLGANLDSYLPILILGVFGLEVLIVSNVVHSSNVLGAILALILWWGVLRPVDWQAGALVVLLCAMLIVTGLAPFTLRPQPSSFGWLPFYGVLGGSMYVNVLAICEKVFLYGSLIYVMWQTRLNHMTGTLVAVVVVSCIEIAQMFFVRHTPEVTDPLLLVLAASTMTILRNHECRSSLSARAQRSRRQMGAKGGQLRAFDAADWISQTVNLRRSQAHFLYQLAHEMEVDISEACRLIIDLALRNGASTEHGDPVVRNAVESMRARTIANGGSEIEDDKTHLAWTNQTIALDRRQAQALARLADENGISVSRSIRGLVSAFMERCGQVGSHVDATPSRRPSSGRTSSRNSDKESSPARRTVTTTPKTKGPSLEWKWRFAIVLGGVAASGLYFAFAGGLFVRGPAIVATVPWAGRDADFIFDHHSHTVFSDDGVVTSSALVDMARNAGCDMLAITDHSDDEDKAAAKFDSERAASGRQFANFRKLRQQHPGFLLFAGVEINMPSYGGREHATVIVDPAVEEDVLPRLRDVAEESIAEALAASSERGSDEEFLSLAANYHARGDTFVMIYNHPSRKDQDFRENYADIIRWNAEAPLFIGFAGAPGHQKRTEPGAYRAPIFTIDRWDPVVAEVGGTWDRLLSEGHQLWGAIASSDFHKSKNDETPCEFSRIHVAASDFSYQSVLKALRAGTFWADHGQILRRLSFSAQITGLDVPVYPGSIVNLGDETSVIEILISLLRGPGSVGEPLQVEFIGNCRTGETELLAVEQLDSYSSQSIAMIDPASTGVDNESCFVRARVRLEMDPEPDLMAYTNPIRFLLR